MNNLNTIMQTCHSINQADGCAALATVVRVQGSAYRRPGTRMLILPDGKSIGSISGGCLEADVKSRAAEVMRTGRSDYVVYDPSSTNGDVVAELGCKGVVGVLIECLPHSPAMEGLQYLSKCSESRQSASMVTVYRSEAPGRFPVGSRLLFCEGNAISAGYPAAIQSLLLEAAREAFRSGRPHTVSVQHGGFALEALAEPIVPPIRLIVAGAGDDANPLVRIAEETGWDVVRAAWQSPHPLACTNLPTTLLHSASEIAAFIQHNPMDARTACVLMNHNYQRDLDWLNALLPHSPGYIGILGPRKRYEQMVADLGKTGQLTRLSENQRVFSPAGLDIAAETPVEIALAILAEIQAVICGASGGSLRNRIGSIHA